MNLNYTKLKLKLSTTEVNTFNEFIKDSETLGMFYNAKGTVIKDDLSNSKFNHVDNTTEIIVPYKFLETDTLKQITDLFPREYVTVKILKFPAKFQLCWHKDISRAIGFNIVLSKTNTITIFSEQFFSADCLGKNTYISQLDYIPGTVYLFNSSRYHSVINLDEKPRYIMLVMISKNYQINYESAYLKLQHLDLLDE